MSKSVPTYSELNAFTDSELRAINADAIKILKSRLRIKAATAAAAFSIGQPVEFTGKGGMVEKGTIVSIGPKNTKVRCKNQFGGNTVWTVTSTLLRPQTQQV